jgi:2-keto-3-deoxy-L-rhamnonate aldolase RhmA
MRFLDFGFSAVLVPEVMEPETVDDAIAYAYYGPIGRRSWGGTARLGLDKGLDRLAYAAWWNDYVILGIQVESVEAVTNIRKLAKPGVSVVTFGPNDLSFSLEDHPGYLRLDRECRQGGAARSELQFFGGGLSAHRSPLRPGRLAIQLVRIRQIQQ